MIDMHAKAIPGGGIAGIARSCSRCGETKALEQFPLDHRRANGHARICRDCKNSRAREIRASDEPMHEGVSILAAIAEYLRDPSDIVRAPKRSRRPWRGKLE